MTRTLGRSLKLAFAAVAFLTLLSGCGGAGGGAGGAYSTIRFDNDPTSAFTIVHVDFDYFDVAQLPDREANVNVTPGQSVAFDFTKFETESLNDVTLTWSDATTTNISLIPVAIFGGGDFSYPVKH